MPVKMPFGIAFFKVQACRISPEAVPSVMDNPLAVNLKKNGSLIGAVFVSDMRLRGVHPDGSRMLLPVC
jgi:hypothetical protein